MRYQLLLIIALCSAPLARAALTVQASPVANLVYQLDCVSGRIKHCGDRAGYSVLWQTRFAIDVTHDEDIVAWARLTPRLPQREGETATSSDPVLLRTASFESRDVDQYLEQIHPFLDAADWKHVRHIVGRVRPAFEDWWTERAQAPLARHVARLKEALDQAGLAQELVRLHAFLGVADDASNDLSVHLMRRVTRTQSTSAEHIGRYAVLEIYDDGSPTQGIPVAVHEYTHFLFSQMPAARFHTVHDNILGISTAQPSLDRLGAWNLFNEALATAFGNGRVGRAVDPSEFAVRMATPGGLYLAPDVDAAAKALLPILDRTFERDGTIDTLSFANDYVAALITSVGPRLRAPQTTLQELAVFEDSSLADRDDTFVPAILQFLPMNHSLWSYRAECCGQEFSRWWTFHASSEPRLAIVRVSQRSAAAALCDDVEPNKPGYSIRILNGFPCMIVAVNDASQIIPALERIAGMSELSPGDYDYGAEHH